MSIARAERVALGAAAATACLAVLAGSDRAGAQAQATPAATTPATTPASEEYLLLGDATRGAGEPMIAVDPTNPHNMIAVAMGNLQQLGGHPAKSNGTDAFHAVAGSTITWLAVTHDGGVTWKVGELPILAGRFTRCPDAFADVTKDGVFLAGCEPRETSGEFLGESAVMVSTDKGETWGKPAPIISDYELKRFAPGLKPRSGGGSASPWDRPFTFVDDSTGVIYGQAGGGMTDIDQKPGTWRSQAYLTASTDGGRSFGTVYAWDSKAYPQASRGLAMTAGHGAVAVTYVASAAPASEGATCPCAVIGVSRDQGRTFAYHVLKTVPVAAGPMQGPGSLRGRGEPGGLTADPTTDGRLALLRYEQTRDGPVYRVMVSEDWGQTWSAFVTAGSTPGAVGFTKSSFRFSRGGVLGLVWRAIHADGSYDIWSAISRDGGHSFSAPLRISHARSPAHDAFRNAGLFGDDIQDVAMDSESLHAAWGDSRAGFQGVWYGRVPFSAYVFPPAPAPR